MSTKSAEVSSKLVGPFRAEDFYTNIEADDYNAMIAEQANARLAPLWEALEDFYTNIAADDYNAMIAEQANAKLAPLWEALERCERASVPEPGPLAADEYWHGHDKYLLACSAVLTAFRALRDREEK